MVLAVGETVDLDFAKASGLEIKESGTVEVNHFTLETSRPRFFAGGDLVTGASNVSNAMAYGKRAAQSIDEQLMDAKRWEQLFRPMQYEQSPPKHTSESRRHHSRTMPARERVSVIRGSGRRALGGGRPRRMLPLPALRRGRDRRALGRS